MVPGSHNTVRNRRYRESERERWEREVFLPPIGLSWVIGLEAHSPCFFLEVLINY